MGKLVDLPVDQIEVPQGNLPRFITGTNPQVVERYAELMADGAKFPSIRILQKRDGKKKRYFVYDGVHRLEAAKKIGRKTINCNVETGLKEERLLIYAFYENLRHGLPLKREEKIMVVQTLYQRGLTVELIRQDTGIPEATLRRWLKPLIEKRRQDEEAARQRMMEKAMELRKQGLTQEEVAKELGVCQATVSNWWRNIKNNQMKEVNKDTTSLKNTIEPTGITEQSDASSDSEPKRQNQAEAMENKKNQEQKGGKQKMSRTENTKARSEEEELILRRNEEERKKEEELKKKREMFSPEFEEAYNKFLSAVLKAKREDWKVTSQEAVLYRLQFLEIVATE